MATRACADAPEATEIEMTPPETTSREAASWKRRARRDQGWTRFGRCLRKHPDAADPGDGSEVEKVTGRATDSAADGP